MTVSELISELSRFDGDLPVVIPGDGLLLFEADTLEHLLVTPAPAPDTVSGYYETDDPEAPGAQPAVYFGL